MDTFRKFFYNRTFMLALLTVLSIVLASFGVVIPNIPHGLVTGLLAVLTGVHAVTAEEAAYIDGLWDAFDDDDEAGA